MLIRFSAKNHLSLRDTQELSLVASSLKDVRNGLLYSDGTGGENLLPAVILYGANASGKTNVIQALRFLKNAVVFSYAHVGPTSSIPRYPFALDPKCAASPSEFSIDFTVDGTRYHFGFTCSDENFEAEWLYSFPRGRQTRLYERKGQEFEFGRSLKGRNAIISELTRPNSLFLSTALQNEHRDLRLVGDFFSSMHTDNSLGMPSEIISSALADGDLDRRLIKFLGRIETGIVDYRMQEVETSEVSKQLQSAFATALRQVSGDESIVNAFENINKMKSIELAHRAFDGSPVFLDFSRESSGTRRLLMLLGPAFKALDAGSCVVVDEIDASLHTLACEALLKLFCDKDTNPRGAQIIATTHDTNLLRSKFLRRDQIWFAEKNRAGETAIYPLSDIRTRQTDNLEKGYLQGRFGAVPFAGGVTHLMGDEDSV